MEGADSCDVLLRGHVQNFGWTTWQSDSLGDAGSGLALEAIQVKLDDALRAKYRIWYRVHVSDIGWMGWTSDGEPAGTSGRGLSIEALEIQLLPVDAPAPGSTDDAYRGPAESVSQQSIFIDGTSVQSQAFPSVMIGDAGRNVPLQSFSLTVTNPVIDGFISYQSQVYGAGWQTSWIAGEAANAGAAGAPLEGVRFQLNGGLSSRYELWYRAYVIGTGWLGWASSGESAGSSGLASYLGAIELTLVPKGAEPPERQGDAYLTGDVPILSYQAHSADVGWQSPVTDGMTAGVTGQSRQLEALRVVMDGAGSIASDSAAGVRVSAHVADIGWQGWVGSSSFAGTTGQGKAIQAIRIELTGDLASTYDIVYRVHSADYGWLGWACNGEAAGTVGLNKRAEAIEIRLLPKGSNMPADGALPPCIEVPGITCSASVMGLGWQGGVGAGGLCGTTGQARGLDAFKLSLSGNIPGGIAYAAHVQDYGWLDAVSSGGVAGFPGSGLRVEAIRMQLTGEVATYFDIWYRAYVENYGWLGWTKNGADAGTSTIGYRLEAFEVRITAKDATAPGSTDSPFVHVPYSPQYALLNVPCLLQYPELPTGCESVALTNVLNYYGFGLAKTTMADSYIPRSSWDFVTSFWGNPHSSTGNCCSAPAITTAANAFLTLNHSNLRAYDITDASLETMYDYVAAGHPVIVWSTMYQGNVGRAYAWQQYNGRSYFTVTNSHTIVLRGFNRTNGTVYISDSLSGYVIINAARFYQLYVGRGSQAVVIC
ncbi:C39 family peptidase [Collinsella sp. An2]|uniref:C39 family peptidase n=1 Tax=Collinsella sp. An2 TaxID=1965585 RepID=UPI001EF65FB3|nr:C39 family peptidase [Collinsella sp. An2]